MGSASSCSILHVVLARARLTCRATPISRIQCRTQLKWSSVQTLHPVHARYHRARFHTFAGWEPSQQGPRGREEGRPRDLAKPQPDPSCRVGQLRRGPGPWTWLCCWRRPALLARLGPGVRVLADQGFPPLLKPLGMASVPDCPCPGLQGAAGRAGGGVTSGWAAAAVQVPAATDLCESFPCGHVIAAAVRQITVRCWWWWAP